MQRSFIIFLSFFFSFRSIIFISVIITQLISSINAQNNNYTVFSSRIASDKKIEIDGLLNEQAWETVTPATGFTEHQPYFGKPARHETMVKTVYNDHGLYVALEMLDSAPDSVMTDLSVRNETGNADWVGLILSPANDGQNGFKFKVTAAGVQIDAKIIKDSDDKSWDAVWHSAVAFTDSSWTAEFLIPWSAIRFPTNNNYNWDINVIRKIRRYREQYTFHPVDPSKHGFLTQSGKLSGLSNLNTPVRLSFMPYGSGYIQKTTDRSYVSYTFNAGLDIKYGIRNNYTLDFTLIPDFGQVRSDDEIYNFSPYEVRYNENRPFFTEGTELFNKAGIFYSRRIGQKPADYFKPYQELEDNEKVTLNPQETKLINATKLSGRNSKGLALGFFNAMTAATFAEISDPHGNTRSVETQPFTNYNMLVLDQSLTNNSYFHIANTNYHNKDFVSNVTATSFQLKNKKQNYQVHGTGMISTKNGYEMEATSGHRYSAGLGKISGNIRWSLDHSAISKDYDPNHMGYLSTSNWAYFSGNIGYYRFTPIRNMLRFNTVLTSRYQMLHEDFSYMYFNLHLRSIATFQNRLSAGINIETMPLEQIDHDEARRAGYVYNRPANSYFQIWISPDYRKKFLVDLTLGTWGTHDGDQLRYWVNISPRIRVSNKSLIVIRSEIEREHPVTGFVGHRVIEGKEAVLFGERNMNKLINSITTSYIVNPLSSFSLRIRHYWVTTAFDDFFLLQKDGKLNETDHLINEDFSVNIFNIDFGYSWNFAPGSFLHIVYKNAIHRHDYKSFQTQFTTNWRDMMDSPANNSFSIKLIYYLDYETTKRKLLKETI